MRTGHLDTYKKKCLPGVLDEGQFQMQIYGDLVYLNFIVKREFFLNINFIVLSVLCR